MVFLSCGSKSEKFKGLCCPRCLRELGHHYPYTSAQHGGLGLLSVTEAMWPKSKSGVRSPTGFHELTPLVSDQNGTGSVSGPVVSFSTGVQIVPEHRRPLETHNY